MLDRIIEWLLENGILEEVLAAALYPVFLMLYTLLMIVCWILGIILAGTFIFGGIYVVLFVW